MQLIRSISSKGPREALAVSVVCLNISNVVLFMLHVLSPEIDPSWRLVTHYNNGEFGWIASIMSLTTGAGLILFAVGIYGFVETLSGRIGVYLFLAAGVLSLSALARIPMLTNMTGTLSTLLQPVGAIFLCDSLTSNFRWGSSYRIPQLIGKGSLVMLGVFLLALALMSISLSQGGLGALTTFEEQNSLYHGAIAVAGYPNRFLIALNNLWLMSVTWRAIFLLRKGLVLHR